MDWNIRKYRSSDESGILALFKEVFEIPRDKSSWTWKFVNNSKNDTLISLAVTKSSKIVGQYALMPVDMSRGQRSFSGAQSLDTMTHSDYRGQGMFTKLANHQINACAEKGYDLIYGFPNENSFPGFINKLGFKYLGDAISLGKLLKSRYLIQKKSEKLANLLDSLFVFRFIDYLLSQIGKKKLNFPNWKIQEIKSFDDEYSNLFERFRKLNDKIMIKRSPEYMKWRYLVSKEFNYNIFSITSEDGRLRGIVVMSIHENRGVINEIICDSDEVFADIVQFCIKKFRSTSVSVILYLSSPSYHSLKALKAAGFLQTNKFKFILKNLSDNFSNVRSVDQFFLSAGDIDIF